MNNFCNANFYHSYGKFLGCGNSSYCASTIGPVCVLLPRYISLHLEPYYPEVPKALLMMCI